MSSRTVRFLGTHNLLIDRCFRDVQDARNALNDSLLLCLAELGVPDGVKVNFDEVLQNRSLTWEVPDVTEEQPSHGPEVAGV